MNIEEEIGMEGDKRREAIIAMLATNRQPISGTDLAKLYQVSRQVIVQDIALLRASNRNIISTNKGYLLLQEEEQKNKIRRTMKMLHKNEDMEEELYTIVDLGGRILDVVVEHDIYGQIMVDLIINNRADVDSFLEKTKKFQTKPLNELTGGIHFHTIEADSKEILDKIEVNLMKKGFLKN